jgi:hypothetical protein
LYLNRKRRILKTPAVHDVNPIVAHLKKAHAEFVAACHEIPKNRWRNSPGNGAWSAGEVVAHLIQVEQRITSEAAKILREAPKPVSFWKRLHLPVSLAENRSFKAKTPVALDAALVKEKDEMLAKFTGQRNQSVALLLSNGGRDLSAYRMPHPFFGSLHFYDWFRLLAHHETRHRKQIREIGQAFRR